MQTIGIKALKDRLSEYVRAAAAGETVLVTDRGRVVAELIAPRVRDGASPAEQKMAELIREGLVTPARVSAKARLPRRKPVAKLADLLREIDESRSDR
jgi:prevent-host-death family protein